MNAPAVFYNINVAIKYRVFAAARYHSDFVDEQAIFFVSTHQLIIIKGKSVACDRRYQTALGKLRSYKVVVEVHLHYRSPVEAEAIAVATHLRGNYLFFDFVGLLKAQLRYRLREVYHPCIAAYLDTHYLFGAAAQAVQPFQIHLALVRFQFIAVFFALPLRLADNLQGGVFASFDYYFLQREGFVG